ncbi:MAG: hypothetical protein ABFD07_02645 [Methanobacterium sp.]
MEQGNGVISPNDLMKKLAQAKKVMSKVETGNFEKGQVNEQILLSNPEDIDMSSLQQFNQSAHLSENMTDGEVTNYGDVSRFNVNKPLDIEKVNNSKLPDAIKKAMIERPIVQPEISLSDGIDMKIIQGAKRLMEQDGTSTKKKPIQEQKPVQHTQHSQSQVSSSDIVNTLIPIMENMIRKVMDEKLNQILTAQQTQSINENLVLKVGDSVFKGKITGVNKSK